MEEDWLIQKHFVRHSGGMANFKIECDALTDVEIETFAFLISSKFRFTMVYGVPRGGLRLARVLKSYCEPDTSLPYLIVDDVGTTGGSMETHRSDLEYVNGGHIDDFIGVVLFWIGEKSPPKWIHPVFGMWP